MRVLITGGGGFLGTKLAAALAKKGELNGHELTHVVQSDIFEPTPVEASYKTTGIALDVSDKDAVNAALAESFDVIFHLAAIVSGQAELEFDLGLNINLFGSLNLFEAARQGGNKPVFVYTSSCAAYGGEWGDEITDFTFLNPQTSMAQWKDALHGWVMIRTPQKPTAMALHRLTPTCSFRKIAAMAVVIKGIVKKIDTVTVRGRYCSEMKFSDVDATSSMPRKRVNPGRCIRQTVQSLCRTEDRTVNTKCPE